MGNCSEYAKKSFNNNNNKKPWRMVIVRRPHYVVNDGRWTHYSCCSALFYTLPIAGMYSYSTCDVYLHYGEKAFIVMFLCCRSARHFSSSHLIFLYIIIYGYCLLFTNMLFLLQTHVMCRSLCDWQLPQNQVTLHSTDCSEPTTTRGNMRSENGKYQGDWQ